MLLAVRVAVDGRLCKLANLHYSACRSTTRLACHCACACCLLLHAQRSDRPHCCWVGLFAGTAIYPAFKSASTATTTPSAPAHQTCPAVAGGGRTLHVGASAAQELAQRGRRRIVRQQDPQDLQHLLDTVLQCAQSSADASTAQQSDPESDPESGAAVQKVQTPRPLPSAADAALQLLLLNGSSPAGQVAAALCMAHSPQYVRDIMSGSINTAALRRIGFPWSTGLVARTVLVRSCSALGWARGGFVVLQCVVGVSAHLRRASMRRRVCVAVPQHGGPGAWRVHAAGLSWCMAPAVHTSS